MSPSAERSPCLHVNHRNAELHRGECRAERRVGVSYDQNRVGLVLLKRRLRPDQDSGRLFGVAPRADLEEEIGRFHPQLLVQQGIHRVVVMLAGIHREDTPGRRQRVSKRARLDGLRAGAVTECQGMGCVGFH